MTPTQMTRTACLALLLCGAAASVMAGTAEDERAEREDIARQRAQVEEQFRRQQAECGNRFFVTSCMDAAQRERRNALHPLSQREAALDDAQRKRKANERMEELDRKQRESAQRQAERASSPVLPMPPLPPRASEASAPLPQGAARSPRPPASQPSAKERAEQEAKARAAYDQKQEEARKEREAARQRVQQNKKKTVPDLPPVQPSSPAASR
jgi:hypothetical protein